ncbi:TetR family transcriptional regulator C-terminal domain-containing protein [Paracoccus sp. 11-3]|uniref:TetR family transcriptional regulator C-terminal domain-containing protein n=1 Tax=Paracoccus amoyensis TaxID=2760093 RepID=A0A926GCF6_9RHOB|nr:TetR family transcriptional regulator C-terminal domain-containing protein [Paracoccus amoyensis]MBC9245762.1 TetR family transcriptional regulator C-terminal domain-containing protein [Paracoccus amoyensis]
MPDQAETRFTRIQQKNRDAILMAALTVFSAGGFKGSTIDQIAEAAGMSKPNVLYYFTSKDEIYQTLLQQLLATWLAPLRRLDPAGDPLNELLEYVRAKLCMARDFPHESRLFAHEILEGAPQLRDILTTKLKPLIDAKVAILNDWMNRGAIRRTDPHHLIFSIWALTQHYADFETQVHAVLGPGHDPYAEAEPFLNNLYRRMLTVDP